MLSPLCYSTKSSILLNSYPSSFTFFIISLIISEFVLDVACNKYVTRGMIHEMKAHVAYYNKINNDTDFKYAEFVLRDGERICTTDKNEALYYAFMMCVSNCPMGLELFMRCSTNYEQLSTIYRQRKNHKLKEDWVEGFCENFVKKLPYAKELIICNEE